MKLTVWAFAIATVVSSTSHAQALPAGLVIGDQVRFKLESASASLNGRNSVQCEGQVARLLLDTVVVRPYGNCGINASSVEVIGLQLEEHRGSQTAHTLRGLIFGVIGGGIAGRLIVGDGCRPGGCDDGELAIVAYTLTGVVFGGIIGTVIGFRLPAGIHWRSISVHFIRLEYPR